MDINQKRQHEQDIVKLMIQIYCRGNHKDCRNKKELCKECGELLEYARIRTQKCPFMATKTFCSACRVHCYAPEKREKIKSVMKYAGPRMMLYHPVMAVKHGMVTLSGKREMRRKRDVS